MQKKNKEFIIKRIDITKISEENKKLLIDNIKFFASIKSKYFIKIIESYIPKKKTQKKDEKDYLFVTTELCKGNLEQYLTDIKKNQKLNIEEIKNIVYQICCGLYELYSNKRILNNYFDMENVLYTENSIFKFNPNIAMNEYEKINNLPPEIIQGKDTDLKDKTDIWYFGLFLYRLFKGKNLNYDNNYETLISLINEDIKNFDNFIKNTDIMKNEIKLFYDLAKSSLSIKEKYRLDFNQFISHPFFSGIYIGRMEDKNKIYKTNEEKEFLNITLINLQKIFFKKLELECFEDSEENFNDLENYFNYYKEKISNEDEKDKLKEIIIYKCIGIKNEDKEIIKKILSSINEYKSEYPNLMFPFILFISSNIKKTKELINEIIIDTELDELDKRFFFYCEDSEDLSKIKKKIYRAYSYYNECGDLFYLQDTCIDLRENKFDFYFNIICIARTQMGKSTFINKYISSFNPGNEQEIRAKEGGNEKSCSTKFAQYYINDYPLKIIDIVGYDGEKHNIEKLNDVIDKMSIILEKNEIHIILYLIKYDTDTLFFPPEVGIFEILQLNVIKPKILFIRTKCKINIYKSSKDESEINLDNLTKDEKNSLKNKLYYMNNNFKNMKKEEEWKNVVKYIFSKEENDKTDYFGYNNVCFINLLSAKETNGQEIQPFGLSHFKLKLLKLFEEIKNEEYSRGEKWVELQKKLANDEISIIDAIKEMNFYNIYTKYLTDNTSQLHKSLINKNMTQKFKIDVTDIPDVMVLFTEQIVIFLINQFSYIIKEKTNNDDTTKILINKRKFKDILFNFIIYKMMGISILDSIFEKIKNKNNNIIDEEKSNVLPEKNAKEELKINIEENDEEDNIKNISIDDIINNLNGIKNNKNKESFMISFLQSVIHFRPFISSFLDNKKLIKGLSKEFYNLCFILASNNLFSLKYFKTAIKDKKFLNEKEDNTPVQFSKYFFEQLTEEFYQKQLNEHLCKGFSNISKMDAFKDYEEKYITRENNFLINKFYIHIFSILECEECQEKRYIFDGIMNLTLLFNNANDMKLKDLLNNYFDNEKVDKKCQKCNKSVKHLKIKKVCREPEILIINIEVNTESVRKIIFDESLEINDFIDEELSKNNKNVKYQLSSFIDYEKENNKIHYNSYSKIENKWYKFNDNIVTEEPLNLVDNSYSACVFFYKKKEEEDK